MEIKNRLRRILGVVDGETRKPQKPFAGDVDSVAIFITVNERSESNIDFSFHSSFTSFASGRSYHQNVLEIITDSFIRLLGMMFMICFYNGGIWRISHFLSYPAEISFPVI